MVGSRFPFRVNVVKCFFEFARMYVGSPMRFEIDAAVAKHFAHLAQPVMTGCQDLDDGNVNSKLNIAALIIRTYVWLTPITAGVLVEPVDSVAGMRNPLDGRSTWLCL